MGMDMDTLKFTQAYAASRSRVECFVRHPFVNGFHYSNGVKECADAGCHWLLDICATEVMQYMKAHTLTKAKFKVYVERQKVVFKLACYAKGTVWQKSRDFTELPAGIWVFRITDDDGYFSMILPTERGD